MKKVFATVIASSIVTAGLLSISALDASAANVKGKGGSSQATPSVECSLSNLTGSTLCEGPFSGNDSNSDLSGLFGVSTWTEWAKVDSDSGTSGGLTVGGGGTSGTWSITGLTSPFMIALKGGPSFSTYYMDGTTTSGEWDTDGIFAGSGSPNPNLSHFTVYTSDVTPPTPPTQEVPEPMTILGSAAALGFGAMFKRKASKQNKLAQ